MMTQATAPNNAVCQPSVVTELLTEINAVQIDVDQAYARLYAARRDERDDPFIASGAEAYRIMTECFHDLVRGIMSGEYTTEECQSAIAQFRVSAAWQTFTAGSTVQ